MSQRITNSTWSDPQNVERLKGFLASPESLSARQIAKAFRDDHGVSVSRNAVISIVARLKLVLPLAAGKLTLEERERRLLGRLQRRSARRKEVIRQQIGQQKRGRKKRRAFVLGPGSVAERKPPQIGTTTMPEDLAIPIGQRRTLLELTSATCRWPIGEGADMFFCGGQAEPERPYCWAHLCRAYPTLGVQPSEYREAAE